MTVTEVHFNLIDEPWIPVRAQGAPVTPLSISDILAHSPSLTEVLGDTPTQSFAIQRLLIAIIRRAVDWGDDPVDTWSRIWRDGAFPRGQISAYLSRVRDRFDLLDPVKPFYQVPDFLSTSGEFKPISLIISDVPTGAKYFTTRAGSGASSLSLAEAARWIVHCQAFDFSGIKTGDSRDPRTRGGRGYPIGVAWAGQLGGVLFEGNSVFETLLLNTVLRTSDTSTIRTDDLPVWERAHPEAGERSDGPPSGTTDLLTWQSRRIHVRYSGGRATGVIVGNGDSIEPHNRFDIEFMTRWRFSEIQSKKHGEQRFYPKTFSPERAMWRGVEGLLADVATTQNKPKDRAPGTSGWLDILLDRGAVQPESVIHPHAFALEYITQASVIAAAVDDRLDVRVALFGRTGTGSRYAGDAVKAADSAVAALSRLAGDLAEAAGGSAEGPRSTARERGFFALDQPFRQWIVDLATPEDYDDHLDAWQQVVRSVISAIALELIDQAGAVAWKGRTVGSRWLDTTTASNYFWNELTRVLPDAFTTRGAHT